MRMSKMLFPSDPIAVGLTAEGVTRLCDDGLAEAERLTKEIRGLRDASEENLTWEATFGAFDRLEFFVQEAVSVPQFIGLCHPNAAVRTAALACEPRVSAFVSTLYLDDDIAAVLKRAAEHLGNLPNPRGRMVEHVLRDYRRNGLGLDVDGRKRLKALNETLTELGQAFEKNLAESTLAITVGPESLRGLPETYINNHPVQSDSTIRITTDTPDLTPFLRYSEDRVAARELYRLSQNRARHENREILERLLILRREKAELLGYATWADFVLETRMAKTPTMVRDFIDRLHSGLSPRRAEEFALYKEEAAARNMLDADGGVSASDASYLGDIIRQKKFQLDTRALSEYFEVRAVERGIMEIASRLYGISFQLVDAPTWHADVEAFDVVDTDGSMLGRIYLDLFPRDDKYKHAAVFPLRPTFTMEGERVLPFAGLICNFPRPGDSPALLDHDQVTTFFHEFGHALHSVLSRSELAHFAGTNVVHDFVEVPSQLFEEWAWQRETLDLFARHHATDALIPEELYRAMIDARTFGDAIFTDRQLFLAKLDQEYHVRPPEFDTSKVLEEIRAEFNPFTPVPDICFEATFGHLVGYDAAYYGYQWALALAFDVRTRFIREGMMSTEVASAYRKTILEPGGGEDETELVTRFLGRAPSEAAYLEYLGIGKMD